MNTSRWGRPLWIFLHTFCEKIKPDVFLQKKEKVLSLIYNLLQSLPCPNCQKDTNKYLKKHKLLHVNTKEECIQFLFDLHNYVNIKLNKPEFINRQIYAKQSFKHIYNVFQKYYQNYQGSLFISLESTYRRNICNLVTEYINNNMDDFNLNSSSS